MRTSFFDVANIALPYNGIIGCPALAKFMVVTHHAYNVPKLPSSWGTLTVKTDIKDAVLRAEQTFKAVVISFPCTSSNLD
jgi:purine nucleoside permease